MSFSPRFNDISFRMAGGNVHPKKSVSFAHLVETNTSTKIANRKNIGKKELSTRGKGTITSHVPPKREGLENHLLLKKCL